MKPFLIFLLCISPLMAQEEHEADDAEMPELPPSKYVGEATIDAARVARNARIRNWAIAGAAAAAGAATAALVAKNHHHHHHKHRHY
jgi:hypothetical protein